MGTCGSSCEYVESHRLSRFIKVANETMCRPIRALTEARGYATSKHMYVWPDDLRSCLISLYDMTQTGKLWWGWRPACM